MVLTNPGREDNPLQIVNEAFCRLTGYPEQEIVGRNCRFLAGNSAEERVSARLRVAILKRRSIFADILNYRRDGSPFRNGVMISPVFDSEGELAWFLGSQVDLGTNPSSAFVERQSIAAERVAKLPRRQLQVLEAMANGLLNKQIAWQLKISEKTVKMHRSLLMERLGVGTTAEAIRIAVEAGL